LRNKTLAYRRKSLEGPLFHESLQHQSQHQLPLYGRFLSLCL
jgi:hypothetical protein